MAVNVKLTTHEAAVLPVILRVHLSNLRESLAAEIRNGHSSPALQGYLQGAIDETVDLLVKANAADSRAHPYL